MEWTAASRSRQQAHLLAVLQCAGPCWAGVPQAQLRTKGHATVCLEAPLSAFTGSYLFGRS